ncbi:hypothetical protein BDZ97DRAFT_1028469 [Flammula alnicola]|nr:hypothetical protein BDZ97DRAFT_1028469 [Flammula alnicola]
MRSLDEIQIPSSPIAPPPGRASSPTDLDNVPAGSDSPTPTSPLGGFSHMETFQPLSPPNFSLPAGSRKRPAEDLNQLVEEIVREKKFKLNDKKTLSQFAAKSDAEKTLLLFSEVFELKSMVSRLAPPDVIFNIPKALRASIDQTAANTLLDSSLAGYLAIAMKVVENSISSGLASEIKENKNSWNTVKGHIRGRLTDFRCLIKGALLDSVYEPLSKNDSEAEKMRMRLVKPLNIMEASLAVASFHRGTFVPVDVVFCARIAFLRNVLVTCNPADYWKQVDKALATARETHNTAKKLSTYFTVVLQEDMKEFGEVTI